MRVSVCVRVSLKVSCLRKKVADTHHTPHTHQKQLVHGVWVETDSMVPGLPAANLLLTHELKQNLTLCQRQRGRERESVCVRVRV